MVFLLEGEASPSATDGCKSTGASLDYCRVYQYVVGLVLLVNALRREGSAVVMVVDACHAAVVEPAVVVNHIPP